MLTVIIAGKTTTKYEFVRIFRIVETVHGNELDIVSQIGPTGF